MLESQIKLIDNAVEKYREDILAAERYIWRHPETGYKEWTAHAYLKKLYTQLGYTLHEAGDIPGFYTEIDTGRDGPCVLILGELDSVICPEHPESDPVTGAVHSCGHNAQSAALFGVAAALADKNLTASLCGRIKLCAVPAEELLEMDFRTELQKNGTIKYLTGKLEFLHRGYFDDVNLAFMVHTGGSFAVRHGSQVGCMAKRIIYKGKAAHAGGAPHRGKNALYAATCGINAVNAIRETFLNSDCIRVHPIITNGGAMVNAIPGEVALESYVRGKTFESIVKTNRKVNQALIGAALSLGTNIEIIDTHGFAPTLHCEELNEAAIEAVKLQLPGYKCAEHHGTSTGSTDMGDLSCIMPVIHPNAPGAAGMGHGMDYRIADPVAACVDSAKFQLALLSILLTNGGQRAKSIIQAYKPTFNSKEEYFAFVDNLNDCGDRILYRDDGNAEVRIDK